MSAQRLCLACASTVASSSTYQYFTTECCGRVICEHCLIANPRLRTYNPCLRCLGGVGVVGSAHEANRRALRVGEVEADEVFVVGDSDEEADEETGLPPYTSMPGTPSEPAILGNSTATGPSPMEASALEEDPRSNAQDNSPNPAEQERTGRNYEYWIKPRDTLAGIALKYGVDGTTLCKMNALPLSTMNTNPHLLHTRTTLVLPPTARRTPSPPPADLQERLERRAKERAAKRLQSVTKEVDHSIANAYVSLAEGDNDGDELVEDFKKKPMRGGEDLEGRAIDRYLDDEQWEAEQKRMGIPPRIQGFPFLKVTAEGSAVTTVGGSGSWRLPMLWGR